MVLACAVEDLGDQRGKVRQMMGGISRLLVWDRVRTQNKSAMEIAIPRLERRIRFLRMSDKVLCQGMSTLEVSS